MKGSGGSASGKLKLGVSQLVVTDTEVWCFFFCIFEIDLLVTLRADGSVRSKNTEKWVCVPTRFIYFN